MEKQNHFDSAWEQELPPENEMKQIHRSIRRRNRKIISISVFFALVVLLVTAYGLIPLIESFYWHPETAENADNASDLTLTFHAYTELFCPGWEVSHVTWQKSDGLAAYDLQITIRDTRKQSFFRLDAALEKGNLMYGPDFADNWANPSWFSGLVEEYGPVKEAQLEQVRETLAQLPEYVALEAAITFPEDLTLEQLDRFYQDYARNSLSPSDGSVQIVWVGIRNYTDPENRIRLCGMDPYTGGTGFSGMEERYPNFSSCLGYPYHESMERHFKSLLQYASDQYSKGEGIPVWHEKDYYQTVLDYVEENGVMSYGAVVVASPGTLLKLLDQSIISYVTLLDGWIDLG